MPDRTVTDPDAPASPLATPQADEVADSLAYAASAARDPRVAQREAELRAEMAAGGLDDANEIRPERIKARLSEIAPSEMRSDHVPPFDIERSTFEKNQGLWYCRRCGRLLRSDARGVSAGSVKPCQM